jgi:hypothetical protein
MFKSAFLKRLRFAPESRTCQQSDFSRDSPHSAPRFIQIPPQDVPAFRELHLEFRARNRLFKEAKLLLFHAIRLEAKVDMVAGEPGQARRRLAG